MRSWLHSVPFAARRTLLCLVLLSLVLPLAGQRAVGAASNGYKWVDSTGLHVAGKSTGNVLVGFRPGAGNEAMLTAASAAGAGIRGEVSGLRVKVLRPSVGQNVQGLIDSLRRNADVAYAEPEVTRQKLDTVPNDPFFGEQYGLRRIHAPRAWDLNRGSGSVKVAVVDTGVDRSHVELDGLYAGGHDFVDNDNNPEDIVGHGTNVAGIVAAETNNSTGIAGTGWFTRILGVKVLGDDGSGTDADVAKGIVYAANQGARVINLSLGGPGQSRTLAAAVKYAQRRGALVVAAAGNSGDAGNEVSYPAAYPGVVGVGATDQNDRRASFSNTGGYVDIVAPGVRILSLFPGQQAAFGTGTSQATPFVSGAAAVIKARYPSLTAYQISQRLLLGADDLLTRGRDNQTGYGRLNLYQSLARSGRVFGVVSNSRTGARLANVTVALRAVGSLSALRAVQTDPQGRYSISNVLAGTRTLIFSRSGYRTASRNFAMTAGGNVRVNAALAPATTTLTGYVRSSAGRGISNARVQVSATSRFDMTDTSGRYVIANAPLGRRTVTASRTYYVSRSRVATTSSGRITRLDFALARKATITGFVGDRQTGKPLSGVTVRVAGTTSANKTDAKGRYTIRGVAAGGHQLRATRFGYARKIVNITARNDTVLRVNYSLSRVDSQQG